MFGFIKHEAYTAKPEMTVCWKWCC